MNNAFASAIYAGTVRHRRFSPKSHQFEYQVFMMYLDTREIEHIFSLSPFWSLTHFAPAQFRRSDFHIDRTSTNTDTPKKLPSVDESVRRSVYNECGIRLNGPIRMLVNLRYWGFNMNPISTYYCFDDAGENLVAILAEVHNTPWNERHFYVLTCGQSASKQSFQFKKQFHVSPFNPIQMDYHWYSTTPEKNLALHLENWQGENKVMDATMTLVREEITATSLNKILIRFPWMTVKVISAIYWQALKLWWKGVPIFNHPTLSESTSNIKTSNQIHKETTHEIDQPY
ncbi:DUF1365 domain-containing protein [Cellvibrio zantedeschiae]|uniref:DUF1365 domain-containing protein n=1 Tax=Cellvibrio zantedeschiae TaxID=1237077 RepID=A0ABQ3B3W3_9GAMM|nr:DUF1365 domain-containing protein [Cellvibrio zantedeschiae]GGY75441.1 DUF1365 domain-containing protein [Cellvibrio zantedeschiae]